MKDYALKNPWLTVLFVVPTVVWGVVETVKAARGKTAS